MVNIFKAEEGKVWKSKRENWIGSDTLVLGKNDSIADYEQIDKPAEPENVEIPQTQGE